MGQLDSLLNYILKTHIIHHNFSGRMVARRNQFEIRTFMPRGEKCCNLPRYILKAANGKYVAQKKGATAQFAPVYFL